MFNEPALLTKRISLYKLSKSSGKHCPFQRKLEMSAVTTTLVETYPQRDAIGASHSQRSLDINGGKGNGKDNIALREYHSKPRIATDGNSTPRLENEQNTGNNKPAIPAVTLAMRRREKIVIGAMCWALFLAGWNDGSFGPLLPRVQQNYHASPPFLHAC
jgi:hypothetical protein